MASDLVQTKVLGLVRDGQVQKVALASCTRSATPLSAFLVTSLFLLFYVYRRRRQAALSHLPGPRPNFLLGNLGQLKGKPLYKRIQEWSREFGKTWHYHEGPVPLIVTADLDFLQDVMVKKFDAFHARKVFPLQFHPDHAEGIHMFLARGKRWKRLRKVMNPGFSTQKLRHIHESLLVDAVDQLRSNLRAKAEAGAVFDIYEDFQRLTCDVICQWAFGLDIQSLKEDDEPFFVQLRSFFRNMDYFKKVPVVGAILFPELNGLIRSLFVLSIKWGLVRDPFHFLLERIEAVIDKYERSGQRMATLLQLMLDAERPWEELSDGREVNGVSRREMIEQSLLIVMAGFETSSTALSYAAHCLATNPHEQVRLRAALDAHAASFDRLSYEELARVDYLDWVVREALRMYPIATPVVNRKCVTPTRVGDTFVPAGAHVVPDTWSIHYDPEVWGPEDPREFCPARHDPARGPRRHPLAWQPFGVGPRQCIGQRFGMLEMKMAIAMLVMEFDILPGDDAPLTLVEGPSITPAEVPVRLLPRGEAARGDVAA